MDLATSGRRASSVEERVWGAAAARARRYLDEVGIRGPTAELLVGEALARLRRSLVPESREEAAAALIGELRRTLDVRTAVAALPAIRRIRRQTLAPTTPRRILRRGIRWTPSLKPRRLMLLAAVLATAAWSTAQFADILAVDGVSPLDAVHVLVFGLLAVWLSQSFWTLTAGFAALQLQRLRRRMPPAPAADGPRLALLVPVYNEDSARVFAGVEAIWRDLASSPVAGRVDLYVLSDTTDPDLWLVETERFAQLRARVPDGDRIYYRRRARNIGRKTGNLEDFLVRHGHRYGYFLVLDADSLMTAEAIERLLAEMDADPRLGLLQAPPMLVRGRTPFARSLQFAGALYGQLAAAGTAFWAMDEGNYWGHNAIIRTEAFMRHCGLPDLPGRPPLGGQILSHDFVEAALMRRAGYRVRIAWDITGSYEEPPATLEQFLKRDRRWCQGNLQHLRVLLARDLHPVSRLHLAIGVMSYLASPLWLLFLLLAAAQAFWQQRLPAVNFDPGLGFMLLPRSVATETMILMVFTLSLLFVPRLLALFAALAAPAQRRAFGGGLRLVASALLEMVFSALLAPIMMLFHTGYVVSILFGAAVDWKPQRRTVSEDAFAELVRDFLRPTLAGVVATAAALAFDPELALWFSPVLAGLVLALPLAILSANLRLGDALAARGLLLTPTDHQPDPVLRMTEQLYAQAEAPEPNALLRATLMQPHRLARHIELLAWGSEPRAGDGVDHELLVRKAAWLGPETLDRKERLLLLGDPELLERAHIRLWAHSDDSALPLAPQPPALQPDQPRIAA
jgi:membrane glycosyltransferase